MGHEESANENAAISSKINVDCMNIGLHIGVHNDVFAFKECGIRIVHLNINHLFPKLDQVKHILGCYYSIDILAFTETFLSDRYLDQELEINGYQMFRIDRVFKGGGAF